MLNIGLEGMMLLGAYAGFLGAYYGHTIWLGYLAGIAAGMVASLFMIVLCIWRGFDQIVVGIAITLAGEGITSVLQGAQFGTTYPSLGVRRRSRSRCSTAFRSWERASSTSLSSSISASGSSVSSPGSSARPTPGSTSERRARSPRPSTPPE